MFQRAAKVIFIAGLVIGGVAGFLLGLLVG
jgi:hypothetical protein